MLQAATLEADSNPREPGSTRIVLDLSGKAAYKYFRLEEPYRAVFDLKGPRHRLNWLFRLQTRHLNF